MILRAFMMALAQLGDRRFRRVLLLGIGLTFALLAAAYGGFLGAVNWLVGEGVTLPFLGEVTWVRGLLNWTSLLVMMVLSVFLMVPVASAITSLFLDEVADAVEERYYPGLDPARPVPFGTALRDTLSFLAVLIVANILALILYVLFAPLAPLIFWALNGFLLGREYFTLAAMRRVGRDGARRLRARHLGTIWVAGTLMAIPLSLPLVNLLIPILGAATFTHIFHLLSSGEASD